jgi:hypothetical protein
VDLTTWGGPTGKLSWGESAPDGLAPGGEDGARDAPKVARSDAMVTSNAG